MGKIHRPRRGSLQYWPRKRAKRPYARIRSWPNIDKPILLGFAGYKVGMTHVMVIDNKPHSLTKGSEISCPVTIIECPPLRVASIRFYKNYPSSHVISELWVEDLNKELSKKVCLPKKIKAKEVKEFDDIRLLVYTQPKLTTIGKKKPELFELAIGGSLEEKVKLAKSLLGKEINITDVFKEGQLLDIHAITKGKGFQGTVKRYGVALRSHKSEKLRRGISTLGPWTPKHVSWRVPQPGKIGYHQRTEYNKWLIKIGKNPEEINPKGGFKHYGIIKNPYILIKGSVPGAIKRLIRLTYPIRGNGRIPKEPPLITYISK